MTGQTFDIANVTFLIYDDPIFSLDRAIEKKRSEAPSPWIRTVSARLKHSDSDTQSLITGYLLDRVVMFEHDVFANLDEANDRYVHIKRIVKDAFWDEPTCENPVFVINELYVDQGHRREKVGSNLVQYLCHKVQAATGLEMEVFAAPRSSDREISRMAREEAGLDVDDDTMGDLVQSQIDIATQFWRHIGFIQVLPTSAYYVRLLN